MTSQVAQNVDVVLAVNESSGCASQSKPPRRSTGRTFRGTESLVFCCQLNELSLTDFCCLRRQEVMLPQHAFDETVLHAFK